MRTHIIWAILTGMLMSACASHQGQTVSHSKETVKESLEYSRHEGNSAREVFRQ